MTTSEVKQHWEERYAERSRIWSGRVNAHLEEIATSLPPGCALDLGCGEGADSLWLAELGWQVLGVDISEIALSRASAEAAARGLTDTVLFVQTDLSEAFPEGKFDLVSAQFLQSMVHLDRERIISAAAGAVAPGGVLIVVDHGAAPPWAQNFHDHVFPVVDEVFAAMNLDERLWDRIHVGSIERDAVGPDEQAGVLLDNLIALRRLSAS